MIAFYVCMIFLCAIGSFISGYFQFIPGMVFFISMSTFSGWQLGRELGSWGRH